MDEITRILVVKRFIPFVRHIRPELDAEQIEKGEGVGLTPRRTPAIKVVVNALCHSDFKEIDVARLTGKGPLHPPSCSPSTSLYSILSLSLIPFIILSKGTFTPLFYLSFSLSLFNSLSFCVFTPTVITVPSSLLRQQQQQQQHQQAWQRLSHYETGKNGI